jgi:non-heme chloroperoxidase
VARYVGRHGTDRVAKVVLVSAVPPLMLRTEANPDGLPIEVFDGIREAIVRDRSQFYEDFAMTFYGYNRPGAEVSRGVVDAFWLDSMRASIKAAVDCVAQFSETDFTADLEKIDVPTLIVHGDDDQVVPIIASGQRSAKIVPGAILDIYEGAPHGLATTRADELNADLLTFIEAGRVRAPFTGEEARPMTH